MSQCATCPSALTGNDRRLGCRRCYACRKAKPGRTYPPNKKLLKAATKPQRDWNTIGRGKPAKHERPPKTSWWASPEYADRSAFMAKADAESQVCR